MKNSLLLEKFKNKLNSLNRDELYDLLVDCGIKGLVKLDSGKGKVILTDEDEIICTVTMEDTVYKTIEINSWNHINCNSKDLTSNNFNFAA